MTVRRRGRTTGRRRGTAVIGLALAVSAAVFLSACSSNRPLRTTATSTASITPIVSVPVEIAETTDGAVAYRIDGSGPALVLIMGFSGSMDSWPPTFVDALARHFTVVVFDNAGIGKTTALPSPLTMTAMADQTAALINSLHLRRPDVLGWSMGGMIAQALTVDHPGDVGRLVLAATLPGNGHATLPSKSALTTLTGGNIFAIMGLLFPSDAGAAEAAYVKGILSYPDFQLASIPVTLQQEQALSSWTSGSEVAGHRIGHIHVPTLVTDGSVDSLIPVANDHLLAAGIPHAQLTIYPGASHGFLFQDQSAVISRLVRFFG